MLRLLKPIVKTPVQDATRYFLNHYTVVRLLLYEPLYDTICNAYIRCLEEMRAVGYAMTGTEAVLCRIIFEIRLKMAKNGHVAQLLKRCHTATCGSYLGL